MPIRPTRKSANTIWYSGRRSGIFSALPGGVSVSAGHPGRAIGALRKLEGTMDEQKMIELKRGSGAHEKLRAAPPISISTVMRQISRLQKRANLLRTNFCAGRLAISSWPDFHFCCRLSSAFRWDRGQPRRPDGHIILGFTGIVQTIPSLALLALLVPLPFFGISARTAIAALFLYGLLPIVRNTATGLQDIAQPIRESAIALGLEPGARCGKFICRLLPAQFSPESRPAR